MDYVPGQELRYGPPGTLRRVIYKWKTAAGARVTLDNGVDATVPWEELRAVDAPMEPKAKPSKPAKAPFDEEHKHVCPLCGVTRLCRCEAFATSLGVSCGCDERQAQPAQGPWSADELMRQRKASAERAAELAAKKRATDRRTGKSAQQRHEERQARIAAKRALEARAAAEARYTVELQGKDGQRSELKLKDPKALAKAVALICAQQYVGADRIALRIEVA